MSKVFTRLATLAFGLFVAGGLAFGATQAFGSSIGSACTGPGQLGSCPPYNANSCNLECLSNYENPGFCDQSDCCQCLL